MKCLSDFILLVVILHLPDTSMGREHISFLNRYKEAIQNYIMTGHEYGWKQCDILSDESAFEAGSSQIGSTPHIYMKVDKMETLDFWPSHIGHWNWTFASSPCLLVNYHIVDMTSLSTLLDFGRAAFQYKRLALVLTMDSGITLEMASNVTKLPFLVAAESSQGKEQFLCPVVGETDLRLEPEMCNPSYVSYKNKTLRFGIVGIPPYVLYTDAGHDGIDTKLLTMLKERLNFTPKLIDPPSWLASSTMVCIYDFKVYLMSKRQSLDGCAVPSLTGLSIHSTPLGDIRYTNN